jgi:hypothetical protein
MKDIDTKFHIETDSNTSAILIVKQFRRDHPERMKQPGITRGL